MPVRPRGLYQAKRSNFLLDKSRVAKNLPLSSKKFELFCLIKAAWPTICKRSVFVTLLYPLLPYGGTISTKSNIDILSWNDSNIEWHCNFNDVWYRIKCLPLFNLFQVDNLQESPSYFIIFVLSQHLCWLHAEISVVCHNHRFIRSPNLKVGSFEIAKIKIAKIISHTFNLESRKCSSAKISRYTVFANVWFSRYRSIRDTTSRIITS